MAGVYVIAHRREGAWGAPCKIGISKDCFARLAQLQIANPHPIGIFAFINTNDRKCACDIERFMHFGFRENRLNGEWFDVDPGKAFELARFALTKFLTVYGGATDEQAFDILKRECFVAEDVEGC